MRTSDDYVGAGLGVALAAIGFGLAGCLLLMPGCAKHVAAIKAGYEQRVVVHPTGQEVARVIWVKPETMMDALIITEPVEEGAEKPKTSLPL